MASDSSRREFLTGRSALRALADAHDKLAEPLPAPTRAETWLTQFSREAMACEFEVLLDAKKYPGGPDAAVEALDLVESLEAQLTVYRDTSEVSRLNQRAFAEPVVLEQRLFELFMQAKELWKATEGALDITSGALTKIWGFYRRQGRMPSDAVAVTRSDESVMASVPCTTPDPSASTPGHESVPCPGKSGRP